MIQKFTVSADPTVYEAWPDVTQTADGRLLCVFSECTHHLDRENARIMLTESRDRGAGRDRPDDVALPPHEGDTKRVFG